MRFELEPDNFNQPDEALLEDLRRVAAIVQPAGITKERYDAHGRWCAATMRKRFGNWNEALRRADIQPTKLVSIPREDVIQDIQTVAAALSTSTLSFSQYTTLGKYSNPTMCRNFGSWAGAARAAGLTPAFEQLEVTDELCFEAIEVAWQRVGRQPRQSDVQKPDCKVSAETITRRFGLWRNALEAFVAYVNKADDDPVLLGTDVDSGTSKTITANTKTSNVPQPPTARTVGWRLRFLIMRRDSFRCQLCGKSPATDLGTVLVIDHIQPWSKGGATVYENLQTLCEVCNGGRSNLELNDTAG